MLNIQPDTFKGTLNSDAPGANEAFADVQDSLDDHETRVAAAESKLATVTAGAAVASVSGTGAGCECVSGICRHHSRRGSGYGYYL